jgi:hypothetical protein
LITNAFVLGPQHIWHRCGSRLKLGVGVCVCVCVCVCVKGNFVDEQGNRTELLEILCVRTVGGLTELMLIHVVVR